MYKTHTQFTLVVHVNSPRFLLVLRILFEHSTMYHVISHLRHQSLLITIVH